MVKIGGQREINGHAKGTRESKSSVVAQCALSDKIN